MTKAESAELVSLGVVEGAQAFSEDFHKRIDILCKEIDARLFHRWGIK